MKIKGFTLIELLVTMLLFLGLSIIGVASYSYFVQKNEQETLIDELRTVLQYAKIQAIILGHPVFLSPLDDSLNWSEGVNLTAINKKNKMELLYQWQWHHPRWTLSWSGAGTVNKITCSNNPAQAISNGRFTLINLHDQKKILIILNRLGRIRVISQ